MFENLKQKMVQKVIETISKNPEKITDDLEQGIKKNMSEQGASLVLARFRGNKFDSAAFMIGEDEFINKTESDVNKILKMSFDMVGVLSIKNILKFVSSVGGNNESENNIISVFISKDCNIKVFKREQGKNAELILDSQLSELVKNALSQKGNIDPEQIISLL